VRCIEVDSDHLFLAGRSFIPTHNSTLGLDIARSATVKHHLIFSLEMSKHEITMRLLSAEAKVPLHHMRAGTLSDEDWSKLARRMGEVADAPLFIDDSPNMTMMEIRAKARRLKQRNDLKLVVIDYLQLMTSGKRVESRQQEVSEFSRALKLLAKELEVPVIAMSQLNRGPSSAGQEADAVRPARVRLDRAGRRHGDPAAPRGHVREGVDPRAGEADIIAGQAPQRPDRNVTVAFQGHYSRFVDMAPSAGRVVTRVTVR
jgi:replicative DNA helicase